MVMNKILIIMLFIINNELFQKPQWTKSSAVLKEELLKLIDVSLKVSNKYS